MATIRRLATTMQARGVRVISSGTTNGMQWLNTSVSCPLKAATTENLLITLGTASGSRTRHRNVSAAVWRVVNGMTSRVYLFDCGEGTTHQFASNRAVTVAEIRAIFITHLHGDHILGLPGAITASVVDPL